MLTSEIAVLVLTAFCVLGWVIAFTEFLLSGVDNIAIGGMTVALVDLLALELVIANHE